MARSVGRTDGHIIPRSDNSLPTPPLAVRDTSDMGTQSGCKCYSSCYLPSSSIRYAGSSNRRFTPQEFEMCPRWGARCQNPRLDSNRLSPAMRKAD